MASTTDDDAPTQYRAISNATPNATECDSESPKMIPINADADPRHATPANSCHVVSYTDGREWSDSIVDRAVLAAQTNPMRKIGRRGRVCLSVPLSRGCGGVVVVVVVASAASSSKVAVVMVNN